MQVEIRVFSEEEKIKVHKRTLEILKETGVCFKSHKAFNILKEAGARTDDDRKIVYFTEEMVEKALMSAPKSFTMGARNPEYDFTLPLPESRHLMSGITTNIFDPYTRQCRESVKADIVNVGRIFQHAETGVAACTGCSANDKPDKTHCLHEMAAMLEGTSKHVHFQLGSDYESPFAGRILEAVLGSKEAVISRKIASAIYCPISPLMHDDSMIDAYLALEEWEIPIDIFSMPVIGMTSPASIFSTICQINAEILSALVLFQTVRPGWPVIYGAAAGSCDHRTGKFIRSGEASLVSLGGTEMAKFYGLPSAAIGGSSYETMPVFLGRADLIDGLGITNDGAAIMLEKILTDDEVAKRCLRISKGIRVDDERDLTDDIKKEGPGGAFIAHKSTRSSFRDRDELYYSCMYPGELRSSINETADSIEIAHKKVLEILSGPMADPLDDHILDEINRICDDADL